MKCTKKATKCRSSFSGSAKPHRHGHLCPRVDTRNGQNLLLLSPQGFLSPMKCGLRTIGNSRSPKKQPLSVKAMTCSQINDFTIDLSSFFRRLSYRDYQGQNYPIQKPIKRYWSDPCDSVQASITQTSYPAQWTDENNTLKRRFHRDVTTSTSCSKSTPNTTVKPTNVWPTTPWWRLTSGSKTASVSAI